MVACVLALLVVAPTLAAGGCLCADGVSTSVLTVQAARGEDPGDGAPCDALCCLGGHCHYGAPLFHPLAAAVPAPLPVVAVHAPGPVRAFASLSPTGLDRPPRA